MERDPNNVFNELKDRTLSYIKLKTDIIKLGVYKRIAKILAILSHNLVVVFLGFFAILFLFITLGFYLGEVMRRYSLGFLMVFLLCLLMLLIAFLCKDWLRTKVTNDIIKCFREHDEENEPELKDILKDERESIDPLTKADSGPTGTESTR